MTKEKIGNTLCPECGAPTEQAYRPFCSRRCAQIDLSRWLNEQYRIPSVEDETEPEDDPGEEDLPPHLQQH